MRRAFAEMPFAEDRGRVSAGLQRLGNIGQAIVDMGRERRHANRERVLLALGEDAERLLLEVLAGQHTNFVSASELESSWQIFTPVLHQLALEKVKPEPYPFGSRGPSKANILSVSP